MSQHQPVFVEPSRTDKFLNSVSGIKAVLTDTPRICKACVNLPFSEALQSGTETSRRIFMTDLETIIQQKSCPICTLLLRCLKQPENDLFAAAHIKDHLKTSPWPRNNSTSNEWLDWYIERKMPERLSSTIKSGNEAWPFGSALDAQQAEAIKEEVKKLFLASEDQDIGPREIETETMSSKNAIQRGARAANIAIGTTNTMKEQKELIVVQTAVSDLSMAAGNTRLKLPCYIVIRVYGHGENKFGAVSVRVYACGRTTIPSVGELCHFTLRSRNLNLPQERNGQLWYGKPLQPCVDLGFFKQCLSTCQNSRSHQKTCGKALNISQDFSRKQWPLVLVDVVHEKLEVLSTGKFEPAYIALSHVWGHLAIDPTEVVYEESNKERLQKPGSLKHVKLAATIRDAMRIVKNMDQRYLWVDKLCVNQTQSEEKEHVIKTMGRIYSRALFTIVDGDSNDSQSGLLRQDRDISHQITATIRPDLVLFLPTSMPGDLSKWESRAWTFQEKMLSRRMLVFSCGFAQWQCQEGVWREDVNARDVNKQALAISHSYFKESEQSIGLWNQQKYGLRYDPYDGSVRLDRTLAFSQYAQCVYDYSMRTIGKPGEILDACAGILGILGSEDRLNTKFLHGLPQDFIDSTLLWEAPFDIRRRNVTSDSGLAHQDAALPADSDHVAAALTHSISSKSCQGSPASLSDRPSHVLFHVPPADVSASSPNSEPSRMYRRTSSNIGSESSVTTTLRAFRSENHVVSLHTGKTPSTRHLGCKPELPPRPKTSITNSTTSASPSTAQSKRILKTPPPIPKTKKPLSLADPASGHSSSDWTRDHSGSPNPVRGSATSNEDVPPSWSWAGWELTEESHISKRRFNFSGKGICKGPRVFYRTPFDVHFDNTGIIMHLTSKGEERLRPLASISSFATSGVPGSRIGLLKNSWMHPGPDSQTGDGVQYGNNDWHYHDARFRDQNLAHGNLSDKNLIISTERAELYLSSKRSETRMYSSDMEAAYPELETDILASDIGAKERILYLDEDMKCAVGTATHSSQPFTKPKHVTAILLSEAQYLGDETRPDVRGYPLYNIMLIELGPSGFLERVGIGKVRKTTWMRAKSRMTDTIILG